MNGRVYDPKLGRFLSPDPFVQAPHTVGGFNRYTYCYNNPLKYTDPSGYVPEYHLSGFDWAYSYAYDRADPRKDNGGAGSGMPGWGGNYQGVWRKMGVYLDNHVPGGYRYNWHSRRYEDIFGNEVDFNTAFNQTIRDYGKSTLKTYDFASFFENLKRDINTEHFSLGLAYFNGSIFITAKSNLLGTTSNFGALNNTNFKDYQVATIVSDLAYGPVNLLTSKSPIEDIFRRIKFLNEKGKLFHLNYIIQPNGYGKNTPMGPYYHKRIKLSGYTYDLRIDPFSSLSKSTYYYNVFDLGFGHLDRFHGYSQTMSYNSGYAIGFYLLGYEGNTLIQIGANNIDAYNFLRELYHRLNP